MVDAKELFEELGGKHNDGFPVIDVPVFHTATKTPYLKAPGVACISKPSFNLEATRGFLSGFDASLQFGDYLEDCNGDLADSAALCKFAGQLCYMSFGPKRTKNEHAEKYFDNIKSSGHGSVLEHANFSFLFYGVSRSLTHELVRHRSGFAYSQLSQRYVSGKMLRFVERPEYQTDERLHWSFERRIDDAVENYHYIADNLLEMQKGGNTILSAEARTDLRKKVNQSARSLLPNETEAPIVVTGNARAWRHFLEMRASEHAEVEIRKLAVYVYLCLEQIGSVLFSDYTLNKVQDGTYVVETKYNKV